MRVRLLLAVRTGWVWLALAAGLAPASVAEPCSLAGIWQGTLVVSGRPTGVLFSVEDSESGWVATLEPILESSESSESSESAESAALALEDLECDQHQVSFSIPDWSGGTSFRGSFSESGDALRGESSALPAAAPPSTDVYLVEREDSSGSWAAGAVANLSNREGYDNQPRFSIDGKSLLYTSMRDGQTDIFEREAASHSSSRLTATEESEYSPTPVPGTHERFSVVRVEADGTQRLWSFDGGGVAAELVLPDIRPVGYHAWVDSEVLALFVLGDPPTLQIADRTTGASRSVALNIGRSLHRVPPSIDPRGVSFVQKAGEEDWFLAVYSLDSSGRGSIRSLARTRPGREDYVWSSSGTVLMGDGSRLFELDPAQEDPRWQEVADFAAAGIDGITRLALSPDGLRLAVVGERSGPEPEAPEAQPFSFERRTSPALP